MLSEEEWKDVREEEVEEELEEQEVEAEAEERMEWSPWTLLSSCKLNKEVSFWQCSTTPPSLNISIGVSFTFTDIRDRYHEDS